MRANASTKLVSLYLFDAIARHAQELARRGGTGTASKDDPAVLTANAAALLRALHEPAAQVGIDSLRHVPPEQREKVRKVVDIWSRAATFPAPVLQRILENGTRTEAPPTRTAPPPTPAPVPPTRTAPAPAPAPAAAPAQVPAAAQLPPHVLALLGQTPAAGAGVAPSPPAASVASISSPQSEAGRSPMGVAGAGAPCAGSRGPAEPEDLRAFDQSTFDPTNSAHWERLARLWKNTYQYEASGPELMMALSTYLQLTQCRVRYRKNRTHAGLRCRRCRRCRRCQGCQGCPSRAAARTLAECSAIDTPRVDISRDTLMRVPGRRGGLTRTTRPKRVAVSRA